MTLSEFFQNIQFSHHCYGLFSPQFENHGFLVDDYSFIFEKIFLTSQQQISEDLISNYPDLLVLKNEKSSLKKSDVEKIQQFCEIPATVSPQRVVIIENGDKLSLSSSNALLKLLEEPPHPCLFFLLSTHPSKILPTILSRMTRYFIEFPKEIKESSKPDLLDEKDMNWLENYFSHLKNKNYFRSQFIDKNNKNATIEELEMIAQILNISKEFTEKYGLSKILDAILYCMANHLKKDQGFLNVSRLMMSEIRIAWERSEFHLSASHWLNQFFIGFYFV